MWRTVRKWGTGEIVGNNVKDKTGILFLPRSLYKIYFSVAAFVCLYLCFGECVWEWTCTYLLAYSLSWQTPSTVGLSTCSASTRGQASVSHTHTHTHTQHTHTHSSWAASHSHHHPSDICLCVCLCRCAFVLAGLLVCEVRLNRCLAMRGWNWGGTGRMSRTYTHKHTHTRRHTHTHAQTIETTLSEKHVDWRFRQSEVLCLSDHSMLCFDPVACRCVCIMCGNMCDRVYVCVCVRVLCGDTLCWSLQITQRGAHSPFGCQRQREFQVLPTTVSTTPFCDMLKITTNLLLFTRVENNFDAYKCWPVLIWMLCWFGYLSCHGAESNTLHDEWTLFFFFFFCAGRQSFSFVL